MTSSTTTTKKKKKLILYPSSTTTATITATTTKSPSFSSSLVPFSIIPRRGIRTTSGTATSIGGRIALLGASRIRRRRRQQQQRRREEVNAKNNNNNNSNSAGSSSSASSLPSSTSTTTTPSFQRLVKRQQFDAVLRMLRRIDDSSLDVIGWMYDGNSDGISDNSISTSSSIGGKNEGVARRRLSLSAAAGGRVQLVSTRRTFSSVGGLMKKKKKTKTRKGSQITKTSNGSQTTRTRATAAREQEQPSERKPIITHAQQLVGDDGKKDRMSGEGDPNPLHVVIRHRAPVHVVDAVIEIMSKNDNDKSKTHDNDKSKTHEEQEQQLPSSSKPSSASSSSSSSSLALVQVVHEELVNDDGMNALHLACAMCCDVAVVRRLLRGPSIIMPALAKDRMGRHAIHWACDASTIGNDHDKNTAHSAGTTSRTPQKKGTIIRIPNRIPKHSSSLRMQYKQQDNMVRIVIRLVRMYPNCTTIRDYMGMTPLDIAIHTGADYRIVAFLSRYIVVDSTNKQEQPKHPSEQPNCHIQRDDDRKDKDYKPNSAPPSPRTKSETTKSSSSSSCTHDNHDNNNDNEDILDDDDDHDEDEIISVPRRIRVVVRDAPTSTTEVERFTYDTDANAIFDDTSSLGNDVEIRDDDDDRNPDNLQKPTSSSLPDLPLLIET